MAKPVHLLPSEELVTYLIIITLVSCLCSGQAVLAQAGQARITTPPDNEIYTRLSAETLYYSIDTTDATVNYDGNGEPLPVLTGINNHEYDSEFKSQTIETILNPGQQIEYMVNMEKGNVLLYSWEMDGRTYYDLHAHQENVDPDIWTRYREGTDQAGHGNLIAPYTGEHGWYWVNMDNKPVKLTLKVTGYFKNIFRIDL